MKRRRCLTPLIMFVSFCLRSAETRAATLTHQYTFNNGFADDAGGVSGSLEGNAQISGGKLQLPGSSSPRVNYGSLPVSVMNGLMSATFEGWFTTNSLNSYKKIFMAGTPDTLNFIEFDGTGVGGSSYSSYRHDTQGQIRVSSSQSITIGTPYYFASIYDAFTDEMRLYLGGAGGVALVGTTSVPNLNLTWVDYSQFFLGAAVGWPDGDFNGAIDEFRVWNGVLTLTEISQNFAIGPVPEPSSALLFGGAGLALLLRRRR